MVLPALVIVFVALALVLRARGGRRTPDRLERVYLAVAPLPLVLVLLVPAVIGFTQGFDGHSRPWINRANGMGIGLSVGLILTGGFLIVRAIRSNHAWGWPLAGGVLVAASPAVIVVITYALLALTSVLMR